MTFSRFRLYGADGFNRDLHPLQKRTAVRALGGVRSGVPLFGAFQGSIGKALDQVFHVSARGAIVRVEVHDLIP
jgi:hypothetical protein